MGKFQIFALSLVCAVTMVYAGLESCDSFIEKVKAIKEEDLPQCMQDMISEADMIKQIIRRPTVYEEAKALIPIAEDFVAQNNISEMNIIKIEDFWNSNEVQDAIQNMLESLGTVKKFAERMFNDIFENKDDYFEEAKACFTKKVECMMETNQALIDAGIVPSEDCIQSVDEIRKLVENWVVPFLKT